MQLDSIQNSLFSITGKARLPQIVTWNFPQMFCDSPKIRLVSEGKLCESWQKNNPEKTQSQNSMVTDRGTIESQILCFVKQYSK